MTEKKAKQQLVLGCILLGILVVLGGIQAVFSSFIVVRLLAIMAVVGCSAGVGAFIRELFILKKA